jgi:urocanate hydratase
MLMLMNNLDPRVAQFPHELITYGGNGAVLSNWAQFWFVMQYLSEMTEVLSPPPFPRSHAQEQTLVMYSGHPMGLFPSHRDAPRVVVTNGLMIPNFSTREQLDRVMALGVSIYGQMTAGSYCYIGPQGIVHGTMITILNAARQYLGRSGEEGGGSLC